MEQNTNIETNTTSTDEMRTPGSKRRLVNHSRLVIGIVVAVVVCVIAGICLQGHKSTVSSPSAIPAAAVNITSSGGFVPATISVKIGQAVVWTNKDSKPHIVASDPYPTDNILPDLNAKQPMGLNDTYSYIFRAAGTYTYHDDLNPSLKGTVVVQ
jgi:plastocyanin